MNYGFRATQHDCPTGVKSTTDYGYPKIAHLREQGIDLIIVPLESGFGRKSSGEQSEIVESIQWCAHSAGLAGTVVPVWREGSGHRFIAPTNWHSFFKSFGWNDIVANLNKELTCG